VHALTAYRLAKNGLIADTERIDASTLPAVKMPNQPNFASPDPRPDVHGRDQ
jgi:hypothetical protein